MINRDLGNYAVEHWKKFNSSITEISKNNKGISLVNSEKLLYNFDKIAKTIYPEDKCPTTADGINIVDSLVELIEFKSGFKKRITKETFDEKKAICDYLGDSCTEYWSLFFKNQKAETDELITSIRFKAIESYLLLEKKILQCCSEVDNNNKIKVNLIIVIDENEIDNMEDTLAELSGITIEQNNCFASIRKSLKRVQVQQDANGNDYFYDHIDVVSPEEFLKRI